MQKLYSDEEYEILKATMAEITTHIPTDKMGFIWNNHNKIMGTQEPQPCACGSAAAHWKRAADNVRSFITQSEKPNE